MRSPFDQLLTAIWVYDIDGYCMHWANDAALSLWEADSFKELYRRNFKPDTSDAVQESLRSYQALFRQGKTISMFWRFMPKGMQKEAFCQFSGFEFEDGRMGLLVEAVPVEHIRQHAWVNSTINLATFYDDGRFLSGNPAFFELMGRSIQSFSDIFNDPGQLAQFHSDFNQYGTFEGDVFLATLQGRAWFHLSATRSVDELGNATVLIHQYDINERKMNELALVKESLNDPLTGILNRKGLMSLLETVAEQENEFALFYIDLDGFKLINDTFGHSTGDQLLQAMGEFLRQFMDGVGLAARIGGDEFVWGVYLDALDEPIDVVADTLLQSLRHSAETLQGLPVIVSASIGVAEYPRDGDSLDSLLLAADTAMYRAKEQGRHRWVAYDRRMAAPLVRKHDIVHRLQKALINRELALSYQPIIHAPTNEIVAFESLLRWHSRDLGGISAREAVKIAEYMGFIVELESWAIEQAISDLTELRCVAPNAKLAINLSALHLSDEDLCHRISRILSTYSHSFTDLIIELTERVLLDDNNTSQEAVKKLCDLGAQISIDNFGSGCASFAYLHQTPASIVKIDHSFVQSAEQNIHPIKCVFQLIESLGMTALIGGVETANQAKVLRQVGISLQQGYFFGRPEALKYYQGRSKE